MTFLPTRSRLSAACFVLAGLALAAPAPADPAITEFMADNKSTVADENGSFEDWIEIHNPEAAAVSLDQWCLTDDADSLTKWRFPAVTLEPGGFLVVWASGKNRRTVGQPLHTNFKLAKEGEYLALVRPDGTTIRQQFAPAFPAQGTDESYGPRFQYTNLLAAGATARWLVPSSGALGTTWTATAFNHASWAGGPTGLGFGLTVPGITVRHVFKNGTMGGLSDCLALLALPAGNAGILSEATVVQPTLNLLGEGSDGHFGFNSAPPAGYGDQYAVGATGWIDIPAAGYYTFGLNSDDGGRIVIDSTVVMSDDTWHGPTDAMGSIYLTKGLHSFSAAMFEGGGGDEVEFYAAAGQLTAWDAAQFHLVGDTAAGGLAATTQAAGTGSVIGTNLQSALLGVNASCYARLPFTASGPGANTALSLVMRYNDGFAAWLNGTRVADRNAPATLAFNSAATAARTDAQSMRREGLNLTAYLPLLASGSNVLAVQGLNSSASDSSFLVLPELTAGRLDPAAEPGFYGNNLATPGWINGAITSLGKLEAPLCSVERGIFDAPFTLTLTSSTPGAQIRYTTDGSVPAESTGTAYSAPFPVSATTVLRARVFKTDWESSPTITQSYLFPDDIITQSADGSAPSGWPSTSGTGQILDFGMDPDIVNHANPDLGGPATVKAALQAIPSVCLTTELSNFLNINGSQGIYANPYGRGFAWERPVSIEWIDPPDATHPHGRSAFQANAGFRVRGGFSRSTDNPKHGFHVYFREDYGPKKLSYPLFGRQGAREFDQIDLRTAENYSWSFGGDSRNTFLREEASRQAQLDMGQPGSRVRYFHLYINGQYWGLYDLDERTEASFAESYFGGDKSDYDVVKTEQDSGYVIGATDGSTAAWQTLWTQGRAHALAPTNENYFRMQGLAADGATPTSDPVLLDPANLIDYLLLTFWTGNLDGATSAFLGNDRANNWFGIRRREENDRTGFRYFVHDFEHTFLNVNEDRTGPFTSANQADFNYSNPLFLHQDLSGNTEYKMRWADRVQKHLFNNGALTPTAWANRINTLAAVVDDCIVAESARWGDSKTGTPFTRASWISAQNDLLNSLSPRAPVLLAQLRADGLYPSIDAPSIVPFGGYTASGTQITLAGPAGGTLYYMADGSDPRAVGGAVKPGAQIYVTSTTSENLVAWSSAGWKYLGTGANLGTTWRTLGFNDSAWSGGTSELGYGDGDEATTITIVDFDPNTSGVQKVPTTYFRRTFTAANVNSITNLALRVEYDDSYAVYLNGTRVAGDLPVDPAYNSYSGSAIEDTIVDTTVIPSLLVEGTNVLAIEIHQANATSSDISMNAWLTATRTQTPTPMVLTGSGPKTLRVRALSGTTWSALTEATFLMETEAAASGNLAIGEIMYHPADPSPAEIAAGFTDSEDFEYLELVNTGTKAVDLAGLYFYDSIDFDFTRDGGPLTLAAGGRLLLVSNKEAFELRYGPGLPVAGEYSGHLNNAGETIVLYRHDGTALRTVTYDDGNGWPLEADGDGYSLARLRPEDGPALDSSPAGWRLSVGPSGSPGTNDAVRFTAWMAAQGESDPNRDGDGDGLTNALEYALGGSPVTPDRSKLPVFSFGTFTVGSETQSYPVLTLTLRRGADDATIEAQSAPSLAGPWSAPAWVVVSSTRNPDGTETRVLRASEPRSAHDRIFFRLRAIVQP